MASTDMNHVALIGRATKDVELKYTQGGTAVASLSIANNKTWTQNNEKKEQVSFFNCIAWAKLGEMLAQYVKKGDKIAIEGRLQQRSWQDQNGAKRSAVEVVIENVQFLGSPNGQNHSNTPAEDPEQKKPFNSLPAEGGDQTYIPPESEAPQHFSDESIPF